MNEVQLTTRIRLMIRKEFPDVYVQRVSDRFLAGVPDLRLVCFGRSGDLEIKIGKGKTSPIQDKVLQRIRAAGGSVGVVWSVVEARLWVTHFRSESKRQAEIIESITGRTYEGSKR